MVLFPFLFFPQGFLGLKMVPAHILTMPVIISFSKIPRLKVFHSLGTVLHFRKEREKRLSTILLLFKLYLLATIKLNY